MNSVYILFSSFDSSVWKCSTISPRAFPAPSALDPLLIPPTLDSNPDFSTFWFVLVIYSLSPLPIHFSSLYSPYFWCMCVYMHACTCVNAGMCFHCCAASQGVSGGGGWSVLHLLHSSRCSGIIRNHCTDHFTWTPRTEFRTSLLQW